MTESEDIPEIMEKPPLPLEIESGVFQYFGDHGGPVGYARVITDEGGTHTYFQPEPPRPPTEDEIEEAYDLNEMMSDDFEVTTTTPEGFYDVDFHGVKRSSGTYPWSRVTEVVANDMTAPRNTILFANVPHFASVFATEPIGWERVVKDEEGLTHSWYQPEPPQKCTNAEREEAYWENRVHNDIEYTYGVRRPTEDEITTNTPWVGLTTVTETPPGKETQVQFQNRWFDADADAKTLSGSIEMEYNEARARGYIRGDMTKEEYLQVLNRPRVVVGAEEDVTAEHTTIYADNIAVATIPTPMPYEALRSDAEGLHAHINGRWHPVATMGQMEKWRDLVKISRETSDRHHQRYLALVQALEKHCEWLDLNNVGPSWRSNPEATAIREIIESTKKL